MKIKELYVYAHELPVKNGPYRMAMSEVWTLPTTLVKLVSDSDLQDRGFELIGDITAADPGQQTITLRGVTVSTALPATVMQLTLGV